jgi:D-glycero-D-manno-heptose 1,7-bisphosphate phosphatase
MLMNAQKAVFLAKDCIVRSEASGSGPGGLRLVDGVGAGLRLLRGAGFLFYIVGTEPGVARAQFEEHELEKVGLRLEELLAAEDVVLTGFSYCPHDPHGVRRGYAVDCVCSLPRTALLTRAGRKYGIDMERSWMIGDTLDQVEGGVRAGCRTVLLDDGRETDWRLTELRLPHHVAVGPGEAALLILEDEHLLDWRQRAVAVSAR